MVEDKPINELIEDTIGQFGKYQLLICAMIFLTKIPVAFHQFIIIFIAPPVKFNCMDNGQNITGKCPCSNMEYDRSVFKTTIITDWDLVCDRAWMAQITQAFVMFGTLVGSFVFGAISDRHGRRPPLLMTIIIQLCCGILAGIVPDFWLFTLLRFFIGVATGGMMVVGYVLMMEFIGKDYREVISGLYQLPLTVGHLLIPLAAYFIRDWTHLQFTLSSYSVIMLIFYWTIPESARWLIAIGRIDDAVKILEQAAKRNNLPTENIRDNFMRYQSRRTSVAGRKGTVFDLFRTPHIRKNTLAMSFAWLVCGFGYYGLSQYIGKLSGSIFVNVAISALVTMPGTLLSIPIMKFVGRKPAFIITFSTAGASLLIFAAVPVSVQWLRIMLAAIGNAVIFVTFIVAYLYTSELYPTVIRNAGVGMCSTLARIGSMSAPFVATMDTSHKWVPPFIFGIIPIVGAMVSLLLPETRGLPLPMTIEEGENLGRKPAE